MDFAFADDLGITLDLIALRTDSQPFTIHMYQHQGEFLATPCKFGNAGNASSQFTYFFDKARTAKTDLVLTPEYSCHWENIHAIIADQQLWPVPGKLWAIGCESITKADLGAFKTLCTAPNIIFHCEKEDLSNNKSFYDPLVYLCWCEHQGIDKLMVLVQFKTAHMGSWHSALERDNLIEGKVIWILKNASDSHCFMSIICSEAMNFSRELTGQKMIDIGWNTSPYYVYHPQANPNPTFVDFIAFRRFILDTEQKEIIALNWNANSTYKKNPLIEFGTTRSGIYTQSLELDLSEHRVKTNHLNGLYYFAFGIKHHAFLLNSLAAIFQLLETRMLITGASAPQARRNGPLVLDVEICDTGSGKFSDSKREVADSHIPFLTAAVCGCTFLMNTVACIFEKERLICITCGELKAGLSLVEMKTLLTFNMKQDTEPNLRITIDDDSRAESKGKKLSFINSVNLLVHDIIPNKAIYPESMLHLTKQNINIGFSKDSKLEKYKHNVIGPNGESKKTTMVIMESASDAEIEKTFDKIQKLFDSDNENKRKVVIFYRRGANYKAYGDPNAGSITHTNERDGANILKT